MATSEAMQELLSFAGVCRWKVGNQGHEVRFPALTIREDFGNRLVDQVRPYRDGAKLDDTGSEPGVWVVEAVFNNTIDEDGLDGNPFALYPDAADKMRESFAQHETGDLYLPTIGWVRARAHKGSRTERTDETDSCAMSLTWREDNEDAVNAASAKQSTVKGSIVRLAEQTEFSAEEIGLFDGSLGELREFMSDLQGLMQAPGRALEDLQAQIRATNRAIDETLRMQQEVAGQAGELFSPRGSSVERRLLEMQDVQANAPSEKMSGRPRAIAYVVPASTSLFAIAASLGQDPEALLDLNASRVADPLAVEAGSVIRIFER